MNKIIVSVRDLDFAVWQRPGDGPTIVFIHGTGFHARVWDAVIENLPGFDCFAIDLRNHGASSKVEPPHNWVDFALDIKAILHALDITVDLGVGHSMGGHSLALAASLAPDRFKSLLLIDPIIFRKELYVAAETKDHEVQKRRNQFNSWRDMVEAYKDRKPFSSWKKRVLEDYCQYGLIPATTGDGFILACSPDSEGSIYKNAMAPTADIFSDLSSIEIPVHILRPPVLGNPKAPDLVEKNLLQYLKNGRETVLPDQTHFIPMEIPQELAQIIKDYLDAKANK